MHYRLEGGKPGDERHFIHKSDIGVFIAGKLKDRGKKEITKFFGGNGGGCPAGFILSPNGVCIPKSGARTRLGHTGPQCLAFERLDWQTANAGTKSGCLDVFGTQLVAGNGSGSRGCTAPLVWDPVTNRCRPGAFGGQAVGEAVMGRYGAALMPGSIIIDRQTCLRGMQLGDDGLCYNKSQISNKQRMWPAGRRPLLTGGDMRAISTAARAGRRLEGATKRLQRLGMMKKPTRRGGSTLSPAAHQRLLEAHATK